MKKNIFIIVLLLIMPINIFASSEKIVILEKCIDGDTAKFNYNDKIITVRFLAIDTPELKGEKDVDILYADKALNFTCNKLKNASEIKLESDDASDEKDKYNRYLAWIFVDGELLQTKLIEEGLAKTAYLYGDYKYTHILEDKELMAKSLGKGIWKETTSTDWIYYFLGVIAASIIAYIIKQIKKKIKL